MTQQTIIFPSGSVNYLLQSSFDDIWQLYTREQVIIITNEHIAKLYAKLFKGVRTLVIPPGEGSKGLHTISALATQLLEMEATRKTVLIGVGGGVITDITGFIASVYMRGVSFGFVPTTLLGMVDAAIGGKNGINVGLNKNILGVIAQPAFILYDARFLHTLPYEEWSNGFAEIIKYACIFDEAMFLELSENNISYYRDQNNEALPSLIERCIAWKNRTVAADEHETGIRKLLNFGHTAAHAIENMYGLPHGKAVGIGMVIACLISAEVAGLDRAAISNIKDLLARYHLPVHINIDTAKAMEILKMDKKRQDDKIDYIVLEKIGKAIVQALPFPVIEKALASYESDN